MLRSSVRLMKRLTHETSGYCKKRTHFYGCSNNPDPWNYTWVVGGPENAVAKTLGRQRRYSERQTFTGEKGGLELSYRPRLFQRRRGARIHWHFAKMFNSNIISGIDILLTSTCQISPHQGSLIFYLILDVHGGFMAMVPSLTATLLKRQDAPS